MPTGLHTHTHRDALFPQGTVELLRFFWVLESSLLELSRFRIHVRNLFEARVIIPTYNDHVRLLSPEPVGWLQHHQLYSAGEPTLLWNHFTHRAGWPTEVE